jgi:hypothetical protein
MCIIPHSPFPSAIDDWAFFHGVSLKKIEKVGNRYDEEGFTEKLNVTHSNRGHRTDPIPATQTQQY